MSVTFSGGPADARELALQRAPLFLRVVVAGRKIDALDQLDDAPRDDEHVYVYRCLWSTPPVHVCSRGRGCSVTVSASYEWLEDVDGEQLRDTEAWRAWATARGHEQAGIADLAARRGDVPDATVAQGRLFDTGRSSTAMHP